MAFHLETYTTDNIDRCSIVGKELTEFYQKKIGNQCIRPSLDEKGSTALMVIQLTFEFCLKRWMKSLKLVCLLSNSIQSGNENQKIF